MFGRKKTHKQQLEDKLRSLYADIYQVCGDIDVCTLEGLCRRMNMIISKLESLKKGLYE